MQTEKIKDNLRSLQALAVEKALASKDMSDIEQAAAISKTLSDQEKTDYDNANQPKILRYEWYKTFASAIVPLLTLLTLGFTVWIQIRQLSETAIAHADAGWRDTAQKVIAQLRPAGGGTNPSAQVDSQLTLQLLRPYFSDSVHGAEAMDIAMMVVTRVDEERAANVLFGSRDIRVTDATLPTFIYRMREIRAEIESINDSRNSGYKISDAQKERMLNVWGNSLRHICEKMSDSFLGQPATSFPQDAGGLDFINCSLGNVDFGMASFKDTIFDRVSLENADMSRVREFAGSNWVGTQWWNAKKIDGKLLQYLLENYYPFSGGDTNYVQDVPTRGDYLIKIKALCDSAGITCKAEVLNFGVQESPELKAVLSKLTPSTVKSIVSDDRAVGERRLWTSIGDIRAEDNSALNEMVAAKLCNWISDADLMDVTKSDSAKLGGKVYVRGYECNQKYTDARSFILGNLLAKYYEYHFDKRSMSGDGKADVNWTQNVKYAIESMSQAGFDFLLQRDGGAVLEDSLPTRGEHDAIENLVSAKLCSVDTSESLLQQEKDAGRKPNTLRYGISCNANYLATRQYIYDELLPLFSKESRLAN